MCFLLKSGEINEKRDSLEAVSFVLYVNFHVAVDFGYVVVGYFAVIRIVAAAVEVYQIMAVAAHLFHDDGTFGKSDVRLAA